MNPCRLQYFLYRLEVLQELIITSPSGFPEYFNLNTASHYPTDHLVRSLSHVPTHEQDGHFVQLYTDEGFLIDVLSRFIGGALAVGDAAVLVATAGHRIELERRLSGRGVDTSKAAAQGRYIVLDASEIIPRFMV